jgi:hypothetical protein
MKKDCRDVKSETEGKNSLSDFMTDFTILSTETFLLINCYVWVAFDVCFEKLLEETEPKQFKQAPCVPRGRQFDLAYSDIKE